MADTSILDEFMTTAQVAEVFGVPVRDVQYYIKRGLIRARKLGYFWMIHHTDIPKHWPPR